MAELFIYGFVAAGLVFWLRSILGTRHGDERDRGNPFSVHPEASKASDTSKDTMSATEALFGIQGAAGDLAAQYDWSEGLERHMSIEENAIGGLEQIRKQDRNFDVSFFMRGAEDAFIAIVESFAEGDKELLKGLLSDSVYKAFSGVIDYREAENQKASAEILSVRKIQILEAWVQDKVMYITVRFVADETNYISDDKGLVLEGNPEKITETIDIWTFGRGTRSRSPAWILYQTRDEDAANQEHKTVPDAEKDSGAKKAKKKSDVKPKAEKKADKKDDKKKKS